MFVQKLAISDYTYEGILIYKNNFPELYGKLEKRDTIVPSGYSATHVDVSSIDEQLPMLQNIDLLRVNVNGHEGQVINGAINTIKKSDKIKIIITFRNEMFTGFDAIERVFSLGFKL